MRRRTRLALATLAFAALALAAGVSTTGHTGVTAERELAITVADDEPYVGVTACVGSSNDTVQVFVTNRLDDDLTVRFAAGVDRVRLRLTAPGFEVKLSRPVRPDGACPAG